MAMYKQRGNTHNVIYDYKTDLGKSKQHWESYTTALEAMQRKAYIDYLQKVKNNDGILKAAADYRKKREAESIAKQPVLCDSAPKLSQDNSDKTYREFAKRWLPFHARKKRLSPNTYDSYNGILSKHILPYFGERVMSTITADEIDVFLDYLAKKPCDTSRSYCTSGGAQRTLSSGSVKKCYTVLIAGFSDAKNWRYITEIPTTTAPSEKYRKRKAWSHEKVFSFLERIKDDKLLHLAVHLAFVCSLRAGEAVGIDIATINFYDRSLWIKQEVQRVSKESLEELPADVILKIFSG